MCAHVRTHAHTHSLSRSRALSLPPSPTYNLQPQTPHARQCTQQQLDRQPPAYYTVCARPLRRLRPRTHCQCRVFAACAHARGSGELVPVCVYVCVCVCVIVCVRFVCDSQLYHTRTHKNTRTHCVTHTQNLCATTDCNTRWCSIGLRSNKTCVCQASITRARSHAPRACARAARRCRGKFSKVSALVQCYLLLVSALLCRIFLHIAYDVCTHIPTHTHNIYIYMLYISKHTHLMMFHGLVRMTT